MSARYPGHNPNPFTSAELGGLDLSAEDVAEAARVARDLEDVADRGTVKPSADFADRVMAAIGAEPGPAPVVAAGSAVRRLAPAALLAAVRDAARITFGRGFPAVARAQALAVVLVAGLTLGAAAAGTAGALGAFNSPLAMSPTSVPSPVGPAPSAASPEPTPVASDSPVPSEAPAASESVPPGDSAPPAATSTPRASSGGSSGAGSGGSSRAPSPSPRPTPAPPTPPPPSPTPSPSPTPTPRASDDGGGGGESPRPSGTPPTSPTPSPTPSVSPTPRPSGDH